MHLDFYKRYQTFTKEELFDVVLHANDYQAEAVDAAKQVVRERAWSSELNEKLEEKKQQDAIAAKEQEEELKDKARYYSKAVEHLEEKYIIEVKREDIQQFEDVLDKKKIGFHCDRVNPAEEREEDIFPKVTYYINKNDLDEVEAIMKSLGINNTRNETESLPEFKAKAYIAVILVVVLVLCVLYKLHI